jgi:hypothetical protein
MLRRRAYLRCEDVKHGDQWELTKKQLKAEGVNDALGAFDRELQRLRELFEKEA